jgi:hypothetical protein
LVIATEVSQPAYRLLPFFILAIHLTTGHKLSVYVDKGPARSDAEGLHFFWPAFSDVDLEAALYLPDNSLRRLAHRRLKFRRLGSKPSIHAREDGNELTGSCTRSAAGKPLDEVKNGLV